MTISKSSQIKTIGVYMPATKAILKNRALVDLSHPQNIHKHNTLLFNHEGKIDVFLFDIIDQKLSHRDPNGTSHIEEVDLNELNNAVILYNIAQREGKVIGNDDFKGGEVIRAIEKYLSPRIINKEEVAEEIYKSWIALQKKEQFIANVSEGRVRVLESKAVRSLLPPLKAIPNFEAFMQGLINCYIDTTANENNIQARTLIQTLQLFLSTKAGLPFHQNNTPAEMLIKRDQILNLIQDHKASPNKAASNEKLKALQDAIIKETGEWLTTVKALVENDIANIVEDFSEQKPSLKSALDNLLDGKEDFSADHEITKALLIIKGYLIADEKSKFYESAVQRDMANKRPSLDLFRIGIRLAIRRAAKEHQIELKPEPALENVNSGQPVPAAASQNLQPIPSVQLVPQSNEIRKYSNELHKQIKKLYENLKIRGTATVTHFDYTDDNCAEIRDVLPKHGAPQKDEGPGYRMVIEYAESGDAKKNVLACYYPASDYQTIQKLLESVNLDYVGLQLNHSHISGLHEHHFNALPAENKLSFYIKNSSGQYVEQEVTLSDVWNSNTFRFDNEKFQELQNQKRKAMGLSSITIEKQYEVFQFLGIRPSDIVSVVLPEASKPISDYREILHRELKKLYAKQVNYGNTAEIVHVGYVNDNCSDLSFFVEGNFKKPTTNDGAGYQMVYKYFNNDKKSYQYAGCYYPQSEYPTIPKLLESINVDYTSFQMHRGRLNSEYDIFITDFNVTQNTLEFYYRDATGRYHNQPARIALDEVWDKKNCILNLEKFRSLQDRKRSDIGVNCFYGPSKWDKFLSFHHIEAPVVLGITNYTHDDLVKTLNANLSATRLNVDNSNIFVHGLLTLARIDCGLVEYCKFAPMNDYPADFIVELKMQTGDVNQFKEALNKLFGENAVVTHNTYLNGGAVFRMSYAVMIEKILPLWKDAIAKLLASKSTLKAYEYLLDQKKSRSTVDIFREYERVGQRYKLDIFKSHFILATLLRVASITTTTIERAAILEGDKARVSGAVTIDIFLDLPLQEVKQFIAALNKLEPTAAAELISENTACLNKPGMYRQISIDRQAFDGPLLSKVQDKLRTLRETDPDFIISYQKQSGTYEIPVKYLIDTVKHRVLINYETDKTHRSMVYDSFRVDSLESEELVDKFEFTDCHFDTLREQAGPKGYTFHLYNEETRRYIGQHDPEFNQYYSELIKKPYTDVKLVRYSVLKKQYMPVNHLVENAISGKIPQLLRDTGGNGSEMCFKDEGQTCSYVCTLASTESLTLSKHAKLFLVQPAIVPRILMYTRSFNYNFEDISFDQLRTILGEKLGEFMGHFQDYTRARLIPGILKAFDQFKRNQSLKPAQNPPTPAVDTSTRNYSDVHSSQFWSKRAAANERLTDQEIEIAHSFIQSKLTDCGMRDSLLINEDGHFRLMINVTQRSLFETHRDKLKSIGLSAEVSSGDDYGDSIIIINSIFELMQKLEISLDDVRQAALVRVPRLGLDQK